MRAFARIVSLVAALAAAACLPVTSKVPVGSTAGFKVDPALLGTWTAQASKDEAPSYLHILGNEDGTMTAVLVDSPYKDNMGDWSVYALRAATLGANRLLNAQERIANGKPSGGPLAQQHVVLLYRAAGPDSVTLYQMDDKAAAAAIRAGEIAGEIEPGESGDVRVTADEPALDAFMKTPRAAKLFSKVLVTLTRVK